MVEGPRAAGNLGGTIAAVFDQRFDDRGVPRAGTSFGQSFNYWRRKPLGPGGTVEGGQGRIPKSARAPQKRDFVPITIRNSAGVKMRLAKGAQL
jgi:hypothetical protein